jgi:SpoVK/Ycf46/Vps4 family AAA+-type ATPase
MPSVYDVKRLVTEHCILPMGSQSVHEKAPHIPSLMITGPRGVGKKMLLQAVCTEVGGNLFDLTPANIADRYPGKAGLNMLLHMVFKVGKAWAPSVVYIGDCEKTWMKKVPKTDKSDPKRVKKALPKILKTLKPEHRVQIIGVSSAPFDAEVKGLCGMYQRIVMVPRPDYASRYVMWRTMIEWVSGAGSISGALDLSSLAKISDGYSAGHIDKAVTSVLSERRVQQLRRKPLTASEFLTPLSKMDPIYAEVEEGFKTWFGKTPLGKKRSKAAQGDDADTGAKKAKKGKKGKK